MSTHYAIRIEAVALTKAGAIAQALKLLACMAENPHEKGHTVGSTNGNASGKITEMEIVKG